MRINGAGRGPRDVELNGGCLARVMTFNPPMICADLNYIRLNPN